ncbi:hypothetical protein Pelo_4339 [Pelomyxa schiedti]|nr:hypothetical protein Pelo_4339 [Pelomyxa schiedti]
MADDETSTTAGANLASGGEALSGNEQTSATQGVGVATENPAEKLAIPPSAPSEAHEEKPASENVINTERPVGESQVQEQAAQGEKPVEVKPAEAKPAEVVEKKAEEEDFEIPLISPRLDQLTVRISKSDTVASLIEKSIKVSYVVRDPRRQLLMKKLDDDEKDWRVLVDENLASLSIEYMLQLTGSGEPPPEFSQTFSPPGLPSHVPDMSSFRNVSSPPAVFMPGVGGREMDRMPTRDSEMPRMSGMPPFMGGMPMGGMHPMGMHMMGGMPMGGMPMGGMHMMGGMGGMHPMGMHMMGGMPSHMGLGAYSRPMGGMMDDSLPPLHLNSMRMGLHGMPPSIGGDDEHGMRRPDQEAPGTGMGGEGRTVAPERDEDPELTKALRLSQELYDKEKKADEEQKRITENYEKFAQDKKVTPTTAGMELEDDDAGDETYEPNFDEEEEADNWDDNDNSDEEDDE